MKVKLLDKEVSELIAAGEVIERPSSIIKELVENSIDAGASSITVEIKNGGVSYIRVSDNGCGIDAEDVPTVFLRHATSKVSSKEDLDNIITLGFRGEALASVSAVSRVELITKTAGEDLGVFYSIENSTETENIRTGCPAGSTVTVRDLFKNVPARRKFLKKDVAEGNHAAGVVSRAALSHPEISFKFIRDNRQEFMTPGNGDLYSAVYSVLGKQFAASLIPADYNMNGISVSGFISKPLFGRANRSMQYFFVNGRNIKSLVCMSALEEAYKNVIADGKFPSCVLFLTIPPSMADVNIHPAKTEVRFTDDRLITDSVYFSVKNAILLDSPAEIEIHKPKAQYSSDPSGNEVSEGIQTNFETPAVTAIEDLRPDNSVTMSFKYITAAELSPQTASADAEPGNVQVWATAPGRQFGSLSASVNEEPRIQAEETAFRRISDPPRLFEESGGGDYKLIGEAFKNYIIAERGDVIIIIDKHAAHERILFEEIKANQGGGECQLLISPVEVSLSYDERGALFSNLDAVGESGFLIRPAENAAVIVEGMPALLEGCDPALTLQELSQNLLSGKNLPLADLIDGIYHTIACRAAIKANDDNSRAELSRIADKALNDKKIRYCPHGRPVMTELSKKELEKQFRRV